MSVELCRMEKTKKDGQAELCAIISQPSLHTLLPQPDVLRHLPLTLIQKMQSHHKGTENKKIR